MKPFSIFIALLFKFSFSFSQITVAKKVNNIKAFTKLTGYIQYFYPSDEAAAMDWHKFIYYGTQKVENCTTDNELIDSLKMLFVNIAPLAQIGSKNQKYIDTRKINKSDTTAYTFWQHNGYGFGDSITNSYQSIRVNRRNIVKNYKGIKIVRDKVFSEVPSSDTILTYPISNSIFLKFPLVLSCDSLNTFPIVAIESFNAFKNRITETYPSDPTGNDLYIRLSNINFLWNVLKHFNTNAKYMTGNINELLNKALPNCYKNKTKHDFFLNLIEFASPLNDGHILKPWLNDGSIVRYVAPLKIAKVKSEYVIEYVDKDSFPFKIGDKVVKINSILVKHIYDSLVRTFSGSPHLKKQLAVMSLPTDTLKKVNIEITNRGAFKIEKVGAGLSPVNFPSYKIRKSGFIDSSIFYLDLDNIIKDSFLVLLPQLRKAKSIIFDIRSRPKMNPWDFLKYVISTPTDKYWMNNPKIIYPDMAGISYTPIKWDYEVDSANLLKAKFYLLTGPMAISYAESVIGHFKFYTNATLIGQNSTGANGGVVGLTLPGSYSFRYTGMPVTQQNGERLFGIGFKPDIYVERTIKGIKENRDEFLERAILEAKKYLNKNQ